MNNFEETVFAAIQDSLNEASLPYSEVDSKVLFESFQEVFSRQDSGAYLNTCNLSADEIAILVEKVVVILSENVITESSKVGQTIDSVFSAYLSKKPFTFQSQIYFDDDHYNQWYGELYPSCFLMEKLEKILFAKKPNYILEKDPSPEFYTTYDLIKSTVSVLARCTIEKHPKRFTETFPITLSSHEADLLICCIENCCRQLHNGKDCLSVLNEERQRVGMASLKQAISGKLRFSQNIDSFDYSSNALAPFLER